MNAPLAPSSPHRVEVIAPDPECAALLQQYAAPTFPAELVAPDPECAALLLEYASPVIPAGLAAGAATIVRLEPQPNDPRWVIELLAVVERWLEAAPLPCAKLLYGGRSYLIRSSTHVAQLVAAAEPATAAIR